MINSTIIFFLTSSKISRHIACLLLVFCMNSSMQAVELWDVMDEYQQPQGRYVLMGDYRVYFHCMGEGHPTVLFDGGIADSSANWLHIANETAKTNKSCVFDRAGYGMSDPGPSPRITSTIVNELNVVLDKADIPGPYVLVGHSFGGFTMQYFANQYPDKIAGLVLVESSHPEQVERLKQLDELPGAERKTLIKVPDDDLSKMSVQQRYWALMNSNRKAIYAQMQELKSFKDSAEEVNLSHKGTLNIPLAVLSRGKAQLPSIEGKYSLEQVWQDMQTELKQLSDHSWQVIVNESGHSIHLEAPDVVIENIKRVINYQKLGLQNGQSQRLSQLQSDIN